MITAEEARQRTQLRMQEEDQAILGLRELLRESIAHEVSNAIENCVYGWGQCVYVTEIVKRINEKDEKNKKWNPMKVYLVLELVCSELGFVYNESTYSPDHSYITWDKK